MLQRDALIEEVTKRLDQDNSIYFLSADFGAAALDDLRERFPKNFLHCGISEQAMLDVATGLTLEGNKVFVYAMAPFLSLRSIEQTKCGPGLMNLPICLISVGIGLGYADSGPTHYSTEDFACFRAIVGSSIYTPSDVSSVKLIAKDMLEKPKFSYVRLDRDILPNVLPEINLDDYNRGFTIFGNANDKKIALISHGKMFHRCLEIYNNEPNKFICVDIIRAKPFPQELPKKIISCKGIVVVDEQSPSGNLSSCIFEGFSQQNLYPKIISKSLPEKYIFENGGRDYLLDKFGLSIKDIRESANKID
jgi:transketolase|tara:strand:- start:137 stop:1054 length:918 start_codon:yes stop_codon:yes gene_type:complete